jgi:tyrosinase
MKFAVFLVPFLINILNSQVLDNSTTTSDSTTAAATTRTTNTADSVSTTGHTCAVTIHRQEVREMSTADWESFVAAFKAMNQDGSLAKYVNWHKMAWTQYHWNSKFLPFHRNCLQEFERDLIEHGAAYLPYWDSTLDSQHPSSSPLLKESYFGANDGMYIVDGPFARTAPMSYTAAVGGRPIIREYGRRTGAFYAQSLIDNEMNRRPEFSDFSKWLEYGPHSVVHSIIGGSHGQLATGVSPEDPLFWVHHCFMDKLWDKHQRRHGYKYEGDAYNENPKDTDEVGYAEWKKKVRDVLHSDDLCVSYSPGGTGGTGGRDNGETSEPEETGIPIANETVIRVPEVAESFLNGTGANLTFVKQLANETKVTVEKINAEVQNTIASGFVASLSICLVALAFTLI